MNTRQEGALRGALLWLEDNMRTRMWLFAALIAALGLGNQDARPGVDKPAEPRAFEPPADGRLTDEHVRTYIAVQRAAAAPSKESPSAAPERVIERVAGRAGRELAAARRLGVDLEEYQWVRARISEAVSALRPPAGSALLAQIDEQVRDSRAKMVGQGEAPQEAHAIGAVTPETIAYNREFLKKYRDQLDAGSGRGR